MIAPFGLTTPARILFGRGEFAKAADLSASLGPHAFVVHGATPRHAQALLDHPGLETTPFACPHEPDLTLLEQALTTARSAQTTHVVAIGGGAAIDLGKAVAALLNATTQPLDHLEVVGKGQPLTTQPASFMAIPTTAGTGAEVTKNAVISVPDHNRKVSLRDPAMLADIALIDPALTDHTPKSVTLACGMDALTQTIEPYISCRANPLTDALCRMAIPRGLRALKRLMQGEDPSARDDMALTSLMGGLALANAGLGAVHGLAGVIGGHVPTAPHGAVCGALLTPCLLANLAHLPEGSRPARHITEIRVSTSNTLEHADITGWARSHGLPSLSQLGLSPALHAQIAQEAQSSSSMAANPVLLPQDILQRILQIS